MTLSLFDRPAVLFLPASNPRAIAKARQSAADLVILDLEDAVKPEDKESARAAAVEAVAREWPMPVAIRINGPHSEWHGHDVVAMMHSKVELIVVPRAETKQDLSFVRNQTGRPIAADSLTLYRGEVVGFCNPGCRDKFKAAIDHFEKALAKSDVPLIAKGIE